jgi:septum site-determining protein MinC
VSSKSEILNKVANGQESVVFKGYKAGLTLIIPEHGSFKKYLQDLKNNLDQSQDFFRDAKVFLKIGKRILDDDERTELIRLIEQYGLNFRGFQTEETPGHFNGRPVPAAENDPFVSTITVKKTVRSGQRVVFEGNLVIIGDVNPGAELAATGDIIVLGKLRGIAHAGAQGDTSAQIIAFQLQPVQIRIAGVITRAPESESDSNSNHHGPEVARIKDGLIIVEKFND